MFSNNSSKTKETISYKFFKLLMKPPPDFSAGEAANIKWLESLGGSLWFSKNSGITLYNALHLGQDAFRDQIFKLVLQSHNHTEFVKFFSNACLHAIEQNDLDVLRWLITKSGRGHVIDSKNFYDLFTMTISNDALDITKWICTESGRDVDVVAQDNLACRLAAWHGQLDSLKWLVEDYGDWLTIKKLEDPSFVGKVVDCRGSNSWEIAVRENDQKANSGIDEWPQETREYLLKVKALQEVHGLEDWKEYLQVG